MSKATNFEQKLKIIKKYDNLPERCPQLYEINILNFKEYDEQHELARSSIINKVSVTAKEFKHFLQNLKVKLPKIRFSMKEY